MPFSAFRLKVKVRSCLLVSGRIRRQGGKANTPGLCYHKDLRVAPLFWGSQLAKELELWHQEHKGGVMLQHVDGILMAGGTREERTPLRISLLNFLGSSGYRASKEKAPITQEAVTYVGFEIPRGQRQSGADSKGATCRLPESGDIDELGTFLGVTGWCRLWIADDGLLVKPLCELLRLTEGPLQRPGESRSASYTQLKRALARAPALGPPSSEEPFELLLYESQAIASGVLTQCLGEFRGAVAYFSKQLGTVSQGWPGGLRAVAATVLLTQEARKLPGGQKRTLCVPHMVPTTLDQKGGHRLSPSGMLKYQAVLLEQDEPRF